MTNLLQNMPISTKSHNRFPTLGSNVTTFVKEVFFISLIDYVVMKWLICDEMKNLTLNLVTYSWQWDKMCQVLLKKFFYISYGLVCDKMTHLWWNQPINTRFCNIFLTVRSNVSTFVKEVFLYLLWICLWRNDSFVTKLTNEH